LKRWKKDLWIVVSLLLPSLFFSGLGPRVVEPCWSLETIVPPCPIAIPFDVGVLSDGTVLAFQEDGKPIGIGENGEMFCLDSFYPQGYGMNGYFEADSYDNIWAVVPPMGQLVFLKRGKGQMQVLVDHLEFGGLGTIATVPGRLEAYFSVFHEEPCLYRFSFEKGLEQVFQAKRGGSINGVEVTPSGDVFFLEGSTLFQLSPDSGERKRCVELGNAYCINDSLTSDPEGNLYVALLPIVPEKEGQEKPFGPMQILRIARDFSIQVFFEAKPGEPRCEGMVYDPVHSRLVLALRGRNDIAVLHNDQLHSLVNPKLRFLSTAQNIAFSPEGECWVNSFELGLFAVDVQNGENRYLGLVENPFQPPKAGMAFDAEGRLWYCSASTGFARSFLSLLGEEGVIAEVEVAGMPSDVVISEQGEVFYTDYELSGVFQLLRNGTSVLLATVPHPTSLVKFGERFLVSGSARIDPAFNVRQQCKQVPVPEKVYSFSPGIPAVVLLDIPDVGFLDTDGTGKVFFPQGESIWEYDLSTGLLHKLVEGGKSFSAAKLGPDGALYLVDDSAYAIYRLMPE